MKNHQKEINMFNSFDKRLVRRSFDQASRQYNQFTALQRTIGERLMSLAENVDIAHDSLLDVGAGTGYLTHQLDKLFPQSDLFALDISAAMLQQTRQRMGANNLQGLVCSDAELLAIKKLTLDRIYSNLAFQWCSQLSLVFSGSYQALKEQGLFLFSTFGPDTLKELGSAWAAADDQVHINDFMSAEQIKKELEQAGFQTIQVLSEDIVLFYETPKQLMLELKGMGAHNINATRKKGMTGTKAFSRMIQSYEKKRELNGLPATFEAVYMMARKQET